MHRSSRRYSKVAAQALVANGAKVYITGRRMYVLEASAQAHGTVEVLGNSGGSLVPLQLDVTSKESIKQAADHITRESGVVNV